MFCHSVNCHPFHVEVHPWTQTSFVHLQLSRPLCCTEEHFPINTHFHCLWFCLLCLFLAQQHGIALTVSCVAAVLVRPAVPEGRQDGRLHCRRGLRSKTSLLSRCRFYQAYPFSDRLRGNIPPMPSPVGRWTEGPMLGQNRNWEFFWICVQYAQYFGVVLRTRRSPNVCQAGGPPKRRLVSSID